MSDSTVQFTSEFVCDNMARKAVESYGWASIEAAADRINETFVIPTFNRLLHSGKIRRTELQSSVRRLALTLKNTASVLEVGTTRLATSQLSTNEKWRIDYVMAVSDRQTPDWVDFSPVEVTLGRREMTITQSICDFHIHRHAISRFMQRELRGAEHIMHDMITAIHMAHFTSAHVMVHGTYDQIALPIGDALLCGRINVIDNLKRPSPIAQVHYCRATPPAITDFVRNTIIVEDRRAQVRCMTYVDAQSMTPAREALWELLHEYQVKYAEVMRLTFEAVHFVNLKPSTPLLADLRERVQSASKDFVALMKTPEWVSFASRAR